MNKFLTGVIIFIGIALIVAAFIYWSTLSGSLPAYFPGHTAGGTAVRVKHGAAALVVGLGSLAYAWFRTGKKKAH